MNRRELLAATACFTAFLPETKASFVSGDDTTFAVLRLTKPMSKATSEMIHEAWNYARKRIPGLPPAIVVPHDVDLDFLRVDAKTGRISQVMEDR